MHTAICPVKTTLDRISGKYKGLILWNLSQGSLRFGEIKKAVVQATPKMLTQQLRELEKDQLIQRKVYACVPPKVEYRLTELGESMKPVLDAMFEWGLTYLKDNEQVANCSMIEQSI